MVQLPLFTDVLKKFDLFPFAIYLGREHFYTFFSELSSCYSLTKLSMRSSILPALSSIYFIT
jgi:hypothetical protein